MVAVVVVVLAVVSGGSHGGEGSVNIHKYTWKENRNVTEVPSECVREE